MMRERAYAMLCSCDIASSSALLWEGIMGSRQPAVLLRETVNVETFGEERKERLSTGRYTLIDVSCRGCYKKLGWHYLAAVSPVSPLCHIFFHMLHGPLTSYMLQSCAAAHQLQGLLQEARLALPGRSQPCKSVCSTL